MEDYFTNDGKYLYKYKGDVFSAVKLRKLFFRNSKYSWWLSSFLNVILCFLRQDFVDAYLSYVFSDSVSEQYSAFSSGFLKVCGGDVLSLFQPSELMAMVVGNTNYNWEEMEKVGHIC